MWLSVIVCCIWHQPICLRLCRHRRRTIDYPHDRRSRYLIAIHAIGIGYLGDPILIIDFVDRRAIESVRHSHTCGIWISKLCAFCILSSIGCATTTFWVHCLDHCSRIHDDCPASSFVNFLERHSVFRPGQRTWQLWCVCYCRWW